MLRCRRPTTSIREVSIHPKKYWCISPPVRRAWGLCFVGSIGNRIMSWHLKRRVVGVIKRLIKITSVQSFSYLYCGRANPTSIGSGCYVCHVWISDQVTKERTGNVNTKARMWYQGQRSHVSISYDRDEENIKTDAPWRVVAWACEHVMNMYSCNLLVNVDMERMAGWSV